MRAGVAAIILDVVVDLAKDVFKTKNMINIVLMLGAFIATCFFNVGAITIIIFFIVLGLARSTVAGDKA